MSVIVLSRVFWSQFKDIQFQDKAGKTIKIGKDTSKLVMLAIADSADDFGENSWQSFETISQKASIERRSVMRVVRGLMADGYLSISGVSRYGTNDYKITLSKLGHAPERRPKNRRPETGDSGAETRDSEAQTGDSGSQTRDSGSPDPSLTIPNPNARNREKRETPKRGDAVDMFLAFAKSPAMEKENKLDEIMSAFQTRLAFSLAGRDAENFVDFMFREDKKGNHFPKFIDWWLANGGPRQYWSITKMRQNWPAAFQVSTSNPYAGWRNTTEERFEEERRLGL